MDHVELRAKLSESIVNLQFEESKKYAQMTIDLDLHPMEIIDALSEGMQQVGVLYERREYFVPELLVAARVMNEALSLLEPYFAEKMEKSDVTDIVIGTVKGDIHDIGKNVLISLLKASGFEIHDLGQDVPEERFIEKLKEINAPILAMSSLLTSSAPEIKAVIELLEQKGLREKVKVVVGGAAVSQQFADEVGADGYAVDAVKGVKLCKTLTAQS